MTFTLPLLCIYLRGKILCNEALCCMKEVENDKKSLETRQVSNVTGQKNHFLRKISCQHVVEIFGPSLYITIFKKKKDLFFLFVTISCVKKATKMRFTMVLTACRNRDLTWYRVIKSYWKWSYAWSRSVKMHPHYKTSYTLQSATKYTKQWRSVVISEKVINIQGKVACRIAINRWVYIM